MHLEDLKVFVPDFGDDFLSDLTTTIIKAPLIGYTQAWCSFLGIEMQPQLVGKAWHPALGNWQMLPAKQLPRTAHGPLILVPRALVRYRVSAETMSFYRGFIRPLFEADELDMNSDLVRTRTNGSRYVHKKSLETKYPTDKDSVVQYVIQHPETIDQYRAHQLKNRPGMLSSIELSQLMCESDADLAQLLLEVTSLPPGRENAQHYHRGVIALFNALFQGALGGGKPEEPLHDGRMRVDVVYDNIATDGFFSRIGKGAAACEIIYVECKNYTEDLANPELDQLVARFSSRRGRVGIIVCRGFDNKERFLDRCRDASRDDRGWVLVLDDHDLRQLVSEAEASRGSESPRTLSVLERQWERLRT